jgi:phage FluMu protein Com
MPLCTLHERLLQDERNAWAAFHVLKDSRSSDETELNRRHRNACDASTSLRLHLANCPECKTVTPQSKTANPTTASRCGRTKRRALLVYSLVTKIVSFPCLIRLDHVLLSIGWRLRSPANLHIGPGLRPTTSAACKLLYVVQTA